MLTFNYKYIYMRLVGALGVLAEKAIESKSSYMGHRIPNYL